MVNYLHCGHILVLVYWNGIMNLFLKKGSEYAIAKYPSAKFN